MTRFAAALLAILLAGPALAQVQTKGTPTLQIDKAGSTRCLYLWDLNNASPTDKSLPFGCIDSKGAWNLPDRLRNKQDIDEVTLRGFGYVGDGTSHPLSGVTSLNGRSTAGWTLSQWQALLPAAGALSDEIDGAVINSVIQSTTGAITLRLGPGTARFSQPIASSCGRSISFVGAGSDLTVFQFGTTNGWNHCATGTVKPDKLELHGITFKSTDTASTSTIGVNARFQPQVNGFYDNFAVNGFNTGMVLDGSAGTTINKGMLEAGPSRKGLATTGVGIWFKGVSTFVNHVQNTRVQHFKLGYRFQSTITGPGLGLEDQSLINSAAGEVDTCVQIDSDWDGYSPIQYAIDNMSCDAFGQGLVAKQAGQLTIKGGNWLVHPATGSWTPAGRDFFNFCRVTSARLENAWISNNGEALSLRSYINLADASCGNGAPSDVKITNNKLEYVNLTTTGAMIVKNSAATGIRAQGNTFTNFFTPQATPPSNAFSWGGTDGASALVANTPGQMISISPGAVPISNVTQTTLGTLSIPPGMWSCHATVQVLPASGALVAVMQAAFNNGSATLPLAPGGGMMKFTGSFSNEEIRPIGPWVFDFTTATGNTSVYVVGVASYSGGSLQMNTVAQCVRLR
ncbi:hypothetical protein BA190_27445 [Labrys sp. WJW]|uniref:hypothetical protein n=1 Tax=Labrys sp. WJW TaxID=1737983 RepID=UPI00083668DE|nr:hypothetical protein [Labrys sp. WJW]OCC01699.1 hypothetical protein BA190_27445 [Labrys sp. WJW]